jgi:hypothetical protein
MTTPIPGASIGACFATDVQRHSNGEIHMPVTRARLPQLFVSALLALCVSAPVFADNPGSHPAYLHALSDLRDARAHLERISSDPIDQAEERAIVNIDIAIGEIKKAAIADGKDIHDHMPVDAHLQRRGRFHKALELLDKARKDVSGEEDQPGTLGLQSRVIHHIDAARNAVKHAMEIIRDHA